MKWRPITAGIVYGIVLIGAVLLAYTPAYPGAFIWDDGAFICEHPLVLSDTGLYDIWFSAKATDYYPISNSAFWLLWRLSNHAPSGFLLFNMLLHGLVTVVVFCFARQLNRRAAWMVALLFAVHPLNVFSVCWLSEIKNTTSAFFFFLSCICLLRWLRGAGGLRMVAGGFLFYLLSLLGKPAGILLPAVFLLLAVCEKRLTIRAVYYSIPLFFVGLAFGCLTVWFQFHNALLGETPLTATFVERVIMASKSVFFYIHLVFAPWRTAIFYPRWNLTPTAWNLLVVFLFALVSFLMFLLRRARGMAPWFFGYFFFLLGLFPVLGFINQGHYRFSYVANHWMYIPLFGLLYAFTASLYEWIPDRFHKWATAGLSVLAVALVLLSRLHSFAFSSEQIFYERALVDAPESVTAQNNLANILLAKGEENGALEHYLEAVHYEPGFWSAHNRIAAIYMKRHDGMAAFPHIKASIEEEPNNPEAWVMLGDFYGETGTYAESVRAYEKALEFLPDDAGIYGNMAVSSFRAGDAARARALLEHALRLDPTRPSLRANYERLVRYMEETKQVMPVP